MEECQIVMGEQEGARMRDLLQRLTGRLCIGDAAEHGCPLLRTAAAAVARPAAEQLAHGAIALVAVVALF